MNHEEMAKYLDSRWSPTIWILSANSELCSIKESLMRTNSLSGWLELHPDITCSFGVKATASTDRSKVHAHQIVAGSKVGKVTILPE